VLTEGQILEGKYRVERLLSQGGMGAVFVGEHTRIKRVVAIKVLHGEKPNLENTKRFEREAEAAGRIGSDHIVEVLDFGTTPEGDRFMVMEFLNGETLKARLKARSPLAPAEAIPIIAQVLEGLAAAHDAGIIHRDLKPDNIFILREKAGRKDFVKLVDFGISKFNTLSSDAAQMTQTGAVMGTPFYMSPEQAKSANEVDARSDLYSVGVMLYEAVTGARPFQATTLTELLFKIVFEEPAHPLTLVPTMDPSFAALIMKSFARDPAERFQSAREMKAALEAWAAGRRDVPGTAQAAMARPMATAIIDPPAPSPVRGLVPSGASMPAFGAQSAQRAPQTSHLGGTHLSATQGHRPPRTLVDSAQSGIPGASHPMQQSNPSMGAPHPMQQSNPSMGALHPMQQSNPSMGAPHPMQQSNPSMGALHPMQQSNPSMSAPGGMGAAGPHLGGAQTLDTIQTWNGPVPPKSGSTGVIVIAAIAMLGLGAGGVLWWVRGHGEPDNARPGTIELPHSSAAAVATGGAAPTDTAALPTATAAATTSDGPRHDPVAVPSGQHAPPPAPPSASAASPTAPATAVASGHAPTAQTATKPPPTAKPGGTVSDLGY
jgi:serine/threonine-protein kinase